MAHAYEGSTLGLTIQALDHGARVAYVKEALGGKALSTLRLRLRELTSFVQWCSSHDQKAFPILASTLIAYTCWLLKQRRGSTSLARCLESCNFAHFVLGVLMDPACLKHPVLQGRLRSCRLSRPPRLQARALTVQEVQFLEAFVCDSSHALVDRFACGVFLFALHSRARLGDLVEVGEFRVDFHEDSDIGFIECVSYSHKSRRRACRHHATF